MIKKIGIFLLLCSCAQHNHWVVNHIQTGSDTFSSSKLSFLSKDPVNGIDLEFLSIEGKIHGYLQVHSQMIPPYQGNLKKAVVTLQIDGILLSDIAHRHEGGQRLLLPDTLQDQILNALHQNNSITIRLEGYKTTISADHFPKYFEEFQSFPIRNPFQLPFKL